MEVPVRRARVDLGRVLGRDLSWRSNIPGFVNIRAEMGKDPWEHMGSYLRGIHQAVWDVLQNLARMSSGKRTQESGEDWKRHGDKSPPRKVSSIGETPSAEISLQHLRCLLDIEEQSCSDRASVIDPT